MCTVVSLTTQNVDRVQHYILFEILGERDRSEKYLRLEQDLYFNQYSVIKLESDLLDEVRTEMGVRQGNILSSAFFFIYSDLITRSIDEENGVRVNSVNLNIIRYSDDTVLVTITYKDLKNLLDGVNE